MELIWTNILERTEKQRIEIKSRTNRSREIEFSCAFFFLYFCERYEWIKMLSMKWKHIMNHWKLEVLLSGVYILFKCFLCVLSMQWPDFSRRILDDLLLDVCLSWRDLCFNPTEFICGTICIYTKRINTRIRLPLYP